MNKEANEKSNRKRAFCSHRTGIAEITASVLTIAITIIAGASVFGYVNSQAGVAMQEYGNAVQGNIGYLQENFLVTQVSYTATSVTIYIYNRGQITDSFVQIELYNATRSIIDLVYDPDFVTDLNHQGTCHVAATTSLENPILGDSASSFFVNRGQISSITLTLPSCYTNQGLGYQLKTGKTYYVQVIGRYGNSVTYFQMK